MAKPHYRRFFFRFPYRETVVCGRLDYSPPTRDLTEQGFRLIGAVWITSTAGQSRHWFISGSQHFINLFVWPSNSLAIREQEQLRVRDTT